MASKSKHHFLTCGAALLVLFGGEATGQAHDHAAMDHGAMHSTSALYGSYSHPREASGTAWQPDSTPMEGYHFSYGDWSMMVHGAASGIYDHQGGDRGDDKLFSTSMLMAMGVRPLSVGRIGFRTMFSLEPLMGKRGYPLLLQTGETADGEHELIDRQHPHDLFMEMALTYSVDIADDASLFVYGGLPGEPALGPAAFMHRWSGYEIPDAPISHHWLDSTHITFGVLTAGAVINKVKLESSLFNGREPDQHRYDIETYGLDSYSFRASYAATQNLVGQVSFGKLFNSEQLHPEVRTERTTASITHNLPLDGGNWGTTFAWGHNSNMPGRGLDAFLLESTVLLRDVHTLFARFENVEKDELFHDHDALAGESFRVNKLALGYIHELPPLLSHMKLGLGGEGSWAFLPETLDREYGDTPFSFLLFVRAKIA